MAALTQSKSLRFLKALNNNAIDTGRFEGNRIIVRRAADALLALKKHGWTRVSTMGRATVIARRDGGWPVIVHRDSTDGQVSVEPPIVDSMKDFEAIVECMTPSVKLKRLVHDWQIAQEAKGGAVEVTWNDPSTPRFKDSEFIRGPGICATTADKRYVNLNQLADAATLSGFKVIAYEEKIDGLTYFDVYFLTLTH